VGPGANLPYYDPSKVKRVLAVEPNPGMMRLARQQQPTAGLDVEFLCLPGERIPLDSASIDTVVSTFTLCTILRVEEVLNGLAAVLRPGGALVFLENSVAFDRRVRRWQRWWDPVLHRVFQGLVLTRDIPALIASVDLRITRLDCGYLGRFPKSWSHACWGIAIKDCGH
jgi:ubiquinone/menaquinone biosynthesis C-methylase UbiE